MKCYATDAIINCILHDSFMPNAQLITRVEIQIHTYIYIYIHPSIHLPHSLGKQSGGSKANDHGTDHVVHGVGSVGFFGQQDPHREEDMQNVEHLLRSLIVGQSPLEHANAKQIC